MSKKPDTRTVAQRNKAIRQEALREQLAEQCRLQHIIDNINKIEDVSGKIDPNNATMDSQEINRLVKANEQRLKLFNKYCPDLKSIELSQDQDNPLFETDNDSLIRRLEQLSALAAERASGSDRHH